MAVQNSLSNNPNTQVAAPSTGSSIASFFAGNSVKKYLEKVITGDSSRFIASVVSAVNTTPTLQECTNTSIMSAALVGESLKLPPSPTMGYYYMVPFNNTKKNCKEAQFQIGYKGYIQLAIRTGQYRKINVMAIKAGELEYFDPLNEEIKVNLMVDDWDAREEAETIGYYAFFELTNGFRKAIYWSKKQMINHADKYSQAFSKNATGGKYPKVSYEDYLAGNFNQKDSWLYSSYWYKDFDGMAYKTLLRQLISKWGIMSIDMQKAFESDMAVIREDGKPEYVDNNDIIESSFTPVQPSQTAETPADPAPQIEEKPPVAQPAFSSQPRQEARPSSSGGAAAALFGNR